MKIALLGASGRIGRSILEEVLSRGHQVTAVVRDPARLGSPPEGVRVVTGDVLDPAGLAGRVAGHDAVVSAIGPHLPDGDPRIVVQAAETLIEGVSISGTFRLVVVGGAGSLEVAPGVQLVDTPEFPAAWKPIALAHREALAIYRAADDFIDWTYVSPAALIEPGQRTGSFRIGTNQLLTDDKGESRISIEDYAVALVDEVEKPQFVRKQMTVGY